MVKTRKIKAKSIENEEIIMAIIIIMMRMIIKIGNRKNIKTLK